MMGSGLLLCCKYTELCWLICYISEVGPCSRWIPEVLSLRYVSKVTVTVFDIFNFWQRHGFIQTRLIYFPTIIS